MRYSRFLFSEKIDPVYSNDPETNEIIKQKIKEEEQLYLNQDENAIEKRKKIELRATDLPEDTSLTNPFGSAPPAVRERL